MTKRKLETLSILEFTQFPHSGQNGFGAFGSVQIELTSLLSKDNYPPNFTYQDFARDFT
jgi:hypothetical protein